MLKFPILVSIILVFVGCSKSSRAPDRPGARLLFAKLVDPLYEGRKLKVLGELKDAQLLRKVLACIDSSTRSPEVGLPGIPDRCFILITDSQGRPVRSYIFATYRNMFMPVVVNRESDHYTFSKYVDLVYLVPTSTPPLVELRKWAQGNADTAKSLYGIFDEYDY